MITLISPYSDIAALGIRSISAYLKKVDLRTRLLFLPENEAELSSKNSYGNALIDQIIESCQGSELIGISLFSCHFERAIQLTESLKKELEIPVLWGGKFPSAVPEECLHFADMVCIGEGEESVLELVQSMQSGKDYFHIQNFWFKKDSEIIKNPLRPLVEDLDCLPFPDYSLEDDYIWDKNLRKLVKMDENILREFLYSDPFSEKKSYEIMTTFGCPYNCTYCFSFKGMYPGQKYVRKRSIGNVIGELQAVKERFGFIEEVLISDDTFFLRSPLTIREFSELYKEKINLPLRCLGSLVDITQEKLSYMINAGLYGMQIGVQTGSERTKKIYNRSIANELTLGKMQILNSFKDSLIPIYDFILDNPYETKEDIIETIKFILNIPRPFRLQLFSLTLFPGTELYKKAQEDGLIEKGDRFIYKKQWHQEEVRYLNFIFHLFNYPVPDFVIKLLLHKYALWLFERESIRRLLSRCLSMARCFHRGAGHLTD